MPVGERKDPYRGYNFLVEIDGITRAGFRECSGLDSTQDPIIYREGNDPLTTRQLPGLNKYSHVSLKRGITDDPQLWEWRTKAMNGKTEYRNVSVILLDDTGAERMRWSLAYAWPTKWVGPTFNATGSEVAIETLDICHEGITRQ